MSTVAMIVGSEEYIREDLSGVVNASTVDVSRDTLDVAIWPVREAPTWDWQAAEWDPDTTPPRYRGRVLIGVAPFALAGGVYNVRWRIHDTPEIPIIGASYLYVSAS